MLLMRFTRNLVLLGALLALGLVFVSADASAQQEQGIQLQPAIIDVSGKPGTKIQTSVVVTNTYDQPVGVSVQSRSLAPEDEPIDPEVVESYDASLWVRLGKESFLIDKLASVTVPIELEVPEDAVPGGHYTLVSFRIVSNEAPDGSGVKINREAGAVILVTVPGELVESADIVTDNSETLSLGGVSRFSHTIMNQGNTHFLPIISTKIVSRDGNIVDTIQQPTKLLLPNTKRSIDIEWDSARYFGTYDAITTVTYGTPTQNLESDAISIRIVPAINILVLWSVIAVICVRFIHKHFYTSNHIYHESFVRHKARAQAERSRLVRMLLPRNK